MRSCLKEFLELYKTIISDSKLKTKAQFLAPYPSQILELRTTVKNSTAKYTHFQRNLSLHK